MILRSTAWEKLDNLEEALFDITSSCILDGFQTQSSMATADRILKEIGTLALFSSLSCSVQDSNV
jgi:import receptor subunit TOM70